MKLVFAISFVACMLVVVLPVQAADVVPYDDVKWTPLNPARGDKSPQAGTLWGDRASKVATGFLVKFKDGFSSPPHIHNVTYRGVVISGLIHNDDPSATPMWMPAGSFWTQPAGEAHITAAKGTENIAYIEIDSGPYLVKPEKEAFDDGERPVNIAPSNIVWLDTTDIKRVEHEKAKIAFLWGGLEENELRGTLLKIPAGASGKIITSGEVFSAVVIEGSINYQSKILKPGSYVGVSEPSKLHVTADESKDTIVYVRSDSSYKVARDGE